jgi:LCP family protein required for cell wall assembly
MRLDKYKPGDGLMKRNRALLIWIGIFTLIGIILLIAACEMGMLSSQNKQQNEEPPELEEPVNNIVERGGLPQSNENSRPVREEAPKTLTIGKPYSKKLVEDGAKNVLITGKDKLNNLYDTIGIVSIDTGKKTVKFIMIPRDTYIEYNSDILSRLKEVNLLHEPGVYRINYTHHVGNLVGYEGRFDSGSISFLADVIGEKFGVKLDDYVSININGFRKLVDHLDGVDIYVPYNMDYEDPLQDLYIHIPKGMQRLYGSDAEGFVRFRQGYKEDGTMFDIGDVGRKKNQLYFMQQLIKQKGTLESIGKIPGLIDILGKNVQHSIGLGDILKTYMSIASEVITDGYEITTENLHTDKMTRVDGASYLVFD